MLLMYSNVTLCVYVGIEYIRWRGIIEVKIKILKPTIILFLLRYKSRDQALNSEAGKCTIICFSLELNFWKASPRGLYSTCSTSKQCPSKISWYPILQNNFQGWTQNTLNLCPKLDMDDNCKVYTCQFQVHTFHLTSNYQNFECIYYHP